MRTRGKAGRTAVIVAGLLCLIWLVKSRGPVAEVQPGHNYYSAQGVLAGDVAEMNLQELTNLETWWLHAGSEKPAKSTTTFDTELQSWLMEIEHPAEGPKGIYGRFSEEGERLQARWENGATADFRKIASAQKLTIKRGYRKAGYGESLTMTADYPQFTGSSELARQINPLIQQAARAKLQAIEDYAWRNRGGVKAYLHKDWGGAWSAEDKWRVISFNTNCASLLVESYQYTGVVSANVYSVLNFRLEAGTWKMITLAELFKSAAWEKEFSALCANKIRVLEEANPSHWVNEPDAATSFTLAPDGIRIFCTSYNEKQLDAVIFLRWEEMKTLLDWDMVQRLFPEVQQKQMPSP